MSYPAYDAFALDNQVTYARWRTYMALQPPFLSHAAPLPVKIDVVQLRARLSRQSTVDAFGWLIRRGYLVVHRRDSRGIPSVTLAYALPNSAELTSAG